MRILWPHTRKNVDIRANNLLKHVELLEVNLEVMYEVVLSICNPILKDQVFSHEYYETEMY